MIDLIWTVNVNTEHETLPWPSNTLKMERMFLSIPIDLVIRFLFLFLFPLYGLQTEILNEIAKEKSSILWAHK